MTGRQDDRQDDRQRILDEYMINNITDKAINGEAEHCTCTRLRRKRMSVRMNHCQKNSITVYWSERSKNPREGNKVKVKDKQQKIMQDGQRKLKAPKVSLKFNSFAVNGEQ